MTIVRTVAEHIETMDVTVRTSATGEDISTGLEIPYVTYPRLDIQRILAEFNMRSGETAVIGGLSRTEEQEVEDGAMNVVNGYPRGFNEANEPDKELIK